MGNTPTPIHLSRRANGGVQIVQGRSYVMLSKNELDDLITDLIHLHGLPKRAEKMTVVAEHT
ncbi:hypothetical protein FHU31_002665 [Mycolicibacterium fluoranthenivorans]|uniref:Uncharacterized protein n=1 Tax=Mycolicibacterium fluoranthenivorans TaxID=258505 RepID=A0A7X5TZQ0_9MYCO|nr:hypothetical protein [Mycolicibacterium fluoranthenivorans]